MKRILDYFYNKKKKKEPVTPYDEYLRPMTDNLYERIYPTSTASVGICGTTITNGTTSSFGSDGITYMSLSSGYQKTFNDLKKNIESIPPKKTINKFLDMYIGDEFKVKEKETTPILNPYTYLVQSEDRYQIISKNNIEILHFNLKYNHINFEINKDLLMTVMNYLQIPPDMVHAIVKRWFWEKNNFVSDDSLELSKFIQ